MQQYMEWLQTCVENIDAGSDIQTYGQALYWQGMLLISLIIPVICVALWVLIPVFFIKKALGKYKNMSVEDTTEIGIRSFWNITLRKLRKTNRKIRLAITLYITATLFLAMPIIIQSNLIIPIGILGILSIIILGMALAFYLTANLNTCLYAPDWLDININTLSFTFPLGYYSLMTLERHNKNIPFPIRKYFL